MLALLTLCACASSPTYLEPDSPSLMAGRFTDLAGLAWAPEQGALYFADVGTDRVYRWEPGREPPRVWREGTERIGALVAGEDEGLIAAEQAAGRLARIDLNRKDVRVLAASFDGLSFEAPRDLEWGRAGCLYVVTRKGSLLHMNAAGDLIEMQPGTKVAGVACNADGTALAILVPGEQQVVQLSLDDAGLPTGEPRILATTGRDPEALELDAQGVIYVASRAGIERFAPNGTALSTTPHVRHARALAFGEADGRTLFAMTATEVWRMRCPTPGARFEFVPE
tara:strand:- start:5215 stop:6060 length:846 start_codon:yes stop_codon:yes gene_type:complete